MQMLGIWDSTYSSDILRFSGMHKSTSEEHENPMICDYVIRFIAPKYMRILNLAQNLTNGRRVGLLKDC